MPRGGEECEYSELSDGVDSDFFSCSSFSLAQTRSWSSCPSSAESPSSGLAPPVAPSKNRTGPQGVIGWSGLSQDGVDDEGGLSRRLRPLNSMLLMDAPMEEVAEEEELDWPGPDADCESCPLCCCGLASRHFW